MTFVLFNADTIYVLGFGAVLTLGFWILGLWRGFLRGAPGLALFLALPLSWALLVPWAGAMHGLPHPIETPAWRFVPIWVSLLAFPVLGFLLVRRLRAARWPAAAFVVGNVPCWLFACAVTGMAASGRWI